MNRWAIAVAAVFLQIALGAVYAWSVFRNPLIAWSQQTYGTKWTVPQVTLTFTIAIFVLGFAAFFGGLWMNKKGPRIVAMTGGALYGIGVFLAGFTNHGGLTWLYATYGVIGGLGLGLGYIVPVAVLVKWFPDKRGLITGIAVGGFGAGALVTAPVATKLIAAIGVLKTFEYLGIAYLVVAVAAGYFMQNPPAGYTVPGWQPSAAQKKDRAARDYMLGEALRTWQWWVLWLILFLNVTAGISLISQEAPIFIKYTGVTAAVAAGMVGIVSLGNALGRVFWAWFSDLTSRRIAFAVMYIVGALLFWLMPSIHAQTLMTVVAFVILMCYGGGFGTMPAFTADYFGAKNVGPIYGLMLTAWSFASAFGPLLIANLYKNSASVDAQKTYTGGLHLVSIILLVSLVLPLIVRPPKAA